MLVRKTVAAVTFRVLLCTGCLAAAGSLFIEKELWLATFAAVASVPPVLPLVLMAVNTNSKESTMPENSSNGSMRNKLRIALLALMVGMPFLIILAFVVTLIATRR